MKKRQDFVSLGCGTYFNKVEYSTVQYSSNNIVIVPYNNTVAGANSVEHTNIMIL